MEQHKFIGEEIKESLLSLPEWNNLEDFVCNFQEMWLNLGQKIQEKLVQEKIESEFPNAHKLFTRWTRINITEKTLSLQVEKAGLKLQEKEFEKKEIIAKPSMLSSERIYVGVDGVMTPLNQQQGYKEGKVGVIFWEKDHQKKKGKRGVVRKREYTATLKSTEEFREKVMRMYQSIVKQQKPNIIVIGDGASWIWDMAKEQFPGSLEILDFYHVSKYIWAVAKAAFPKKDIEQKDWVEQQKKLLFESQWEQVISNTHKFRSSRKELREAIKKLENYLNNNSPRIDYKRYLKEGLMIGSGVVESSNRPIVTQRLKQAGMHWSQQGAEGVMALRAAYLSSSKRWSNFWFSSLNKMPDYA